MVSGALAGLVHNWPPKLGAIILAGLIWLFVTGTVTETKQSTLSIPITTVGMSTNQVAIGLPEVVFVTVSGVDSRVDRLRPENLEALLDLSNIQGDFERNIDVLGPRDINIVGWEPRVVTGQLETVSNKQVPVTIIYLGAPENASVLTATATPDLVVARGPSGPLGRVEQALALVPAEANSFEATLFGADAAGLPVRDVSLAPAAATVTVAARPLLETGEVDLVFVPPDLPGLISASVDRVRIAVAAPAEVLAQLSTVEAIVEFTTPIPPPGEYTFPVTLALPAGVATLEVPTATLRFGRSPIDE